MAALNRRARLGLAALLGAAVLVSGCSHVAALRWPWSHKVQAAPSPVNELIETNTSGNAASYPQYWKRNTLLVDLHGVAAEGNLVLTLRAGMLWPARLAFRVTPGSIGVLEVRGEQRLVLPVAEAGPAVDLELPPGVYTASTAQITLRWSVH